MAIDTQSAAAIQSRATALVAAAPGRVVLVPTDDTPASAPALRIAAALAQGGAAVHAVHVVDTRSAPIPPPLDIAISFADATYGDAEGLRRNFARITALPPEKSDNRGRVRRIRAGGARGVRRA